MVVNRQRLRNFLLEQRIAPEAIDTSMQNAEQVFLLVEGKRELLELVDEASKAEVLAVLQELFGAHEIHQVAFVSTSKPFPKPDWMANQIYKAPTMHSVTTTFAGCLSLTYGNTLYKGLQQKHEENWLRLGEALGFHDTGETLTHSLYYYFGFLLGGPDYEEQLAKLEKVIKILPKGCMPLGLKIDDPKICIVLFA